MYYTEKMCYSCNSKGSCWYFWGINNPGWLFGLVFFCCIPKNKVSPDKREDTGSMNYLANEAENIYQNLGKPY